MNVDTIFSEMLPYLIAGVPVTLQVSVLALLLAVVSSVLLALGRMSPWAVVRWPAGFIIEVFRGTSAIVQLFWAFYVLPFFGIVLSPMTAGVLVLGLCEGAYFSEVVRAALTSLLRGQRDAVTSLHLPRGYAFFRITLPQALPLMMPPFSNAAVGMIKFSSLVSLVTLQDVTFRVHALHSTYGDSITVYTAAMVVYLVLSLITVMALLQVELYVNQKAGRTVVKRKIFQGPAPAIPQWAFGR
jgi:polar amino acid transport system permease protein